MANTLLCHIIYSYIARVFATKIFSTISILPLYSKCLSPFDLLYSPPLSYCFHSLLLSFCTTRQYPNFLLSLLFIYGRAYTLRQWKFFRINDTSIYNALYTGNGSIIWRIPRFPNLGPQKTQGRDNSQTIRKESLLWKLYHPPG